MMKTLTAGWIVATALFAGVVAAEDVVVHIRTHGTPAPSETILSVHPARSSRSDAPLVTRSADAGGEARISVPSGDWALDVRAPNFWHERQYFNVSTAQTLVVADLWPAGRLTGEAAVASSGTPPAEITLWLETSEAEAQGRHSFRVVCPVEKGRFRCDVPAGLFD